MTMKKIKAQNFVILIVLSFFAYYFCLTGSNKFGALILVVSVFYAFYILLILTDKSLASIFDEDSFLEKLCVKCGASLKPSKSSLFTQKIISEGPYLVYLVKCPKCGYDNS